MGIIHIAGTKGKGSTSAFVSSILSQYLPSASQPHPRFKKIGLYTSPHLRFVRERIRINNEPLSEQLFAKYFFQTWDRLEEAAKAFGAPTDTSAKPVYFRFLTLMALHTFISEGVDTAIIECGIGGEYDSTNIVKNPTVTGITSLGIDHTAILGLTIEEIAWHKAGIMKYSAPCFTVAQPEAATTVLRERAKEKQVDLKVVDRHPQLQEITLGLAADFQKTNGSLAIQVAAARLRSLGYDEVATDPLPEEFVRGLEQVKWGGRCETRHEGNFTWHLDGAHTRESITVACEWFASCCTPTSKICTSTPSPRILLFNQQTRDPVPLLRHLYHLLCNSLDTMHPFTHAIFCSNITFAEGGYRPDLASLNTSKKTIDELEVQKGLAKAWAEITSGAHGEVERTIEGGVKRCREIIRDGKGQVFVTGSVHLVGGVLEVLEDGRVEQR